MCANFENPRLRNRELGLKNQGDFWLEILLICLLLGPAKVNTVKIFSGPYYIIKRIPTLVSGTLEPV